MIFKKNMIVVLTNGRLAGKKAIVLNVIDENSILVGGINRVPYEVKEHAASWEKRKAAKFLTFIKKVNIKHSIASRYKEDIDVGKLDIDANLSDVSIKAEVNKKLNILLKNIYEVNKNKFLFNKMKIEA
ncbi:ribosomal prt L27 [Enterospora canceri]|uniref:Ribosomal prt L27 n=1 Tax=Enterospora canceri TaxID=1081671 RepID=A0A1Y1S9M2_9MICR|nr:ribosomal prt L27 [Enterospora canceri]